MTFVEAIYATQTGYGIQRAAWHAEPFRILHVKDGRLQWVEPSWHAPIVGGADAARDVTSADLMADDWQTV